MNFIIVTILIAIPIFLIRRIRNTSNPKGREYSKDEIYSLGYHDLNPVFVNYYVYQKHGAGKYKLIEHHKNITAQGAYTIIKRIRKTHKGAISYVDELAPSRDFDKNKLSEKAWQNPQGETIYKNDFKSLISEKKVFVIFHIIKNFDYRNDHFNNSEVVTFYDVSVEDVYGKVKECKNIKNEIQYSFCGIVK